DSRVTATDGGAIPMAEQSETVDAERIEKLEQSVRGLRTALKLASAILVVLLLLNTGWDYLTSANPMAYRFLARSSSWESDPVDFARLWPSRLELLDGKATRAQMDLTKWPGEDDRIARITLATKPPEDDPGAGDRVTLYAFEAGGSLRLCGPDGRVRIELLAGADGGEPAIKIFGDDGKLTWSAP
ncbi:hypothetical protein ACFL59_10960, partial [Planctomycetota bacterium]